MSERFNPWRLFYGSQVPNWLLERKEVSAGAKLTYARLAQYAGESGVCKPRQATLAKELGVSDRQVRYYLSELEKLALIECQQMGLSQANRYFFLRHRWMKSPVLEDEPTSDQDRKNTSTQDRKHASGQDRKDSSAPIGIDSEEENQENNRHSLRSPDQQPLREKKTLFQPPSETEVKERMAKLPSKQASEEASKFWHHHEARGWMLGRVKMKNWHSAVATWLSNIDTFAPRNGSNGHSKPDPAANYKLLE